MVVEIILLDTMQFGWTRKLIRPGLCNMEMPEFLSWFLERSLSDIAIFQMHFLAFI